MRTKFEPVHHALHFVGQLQFLVCGVRCPFALPLSRMVSMAPTLLMTLPWT